MIMLLSAKNLTKEYTRSGRNFAAVKDVNLTLLAGDFISIIGRSGSGKSTLLNLLAGLIRPTSGEITADGKKISDLNDMEISEYRNTVIGYIPQGQSVLQNLNVIDNVRVPEYLSKRKQDPPHMAADDLLTLVGISHLAESFPRSLSGGELRRVAIARALINCPLILIADEPTGDLDTQTTKEIMEIFQSISKQGTAVLMVTHEPDTTVYGNKVFVMENGFLLEKQVEII